MRLEDPSTLPRGAKRFVSYWLRDLAADFDRRNAAALIPTTSLICGSVGAAVAWFASPSFWGEIQNAVAFYAAVLAVNAILLAVCWAAFSRIMDTMGDPEFGAWMRHQRLDGLYNFYIDFIHLTQTVAVVCAAGGLLVSIVNPLEWAARLALGATVATSLYAGRWTQGCVRIMQELASLGPGSSRMTRFASIQLLITASPPPGQLSVVPAPRRRGPD